MEEVRVPKWGLNMEEATVVEWLKNVGDAVRAGEPLVTLETDKATGDVESVVNGVLVEQCAAVDDVVPVEGLLARIEPEG